MKTKALALSITAVLVACFWGVSNASASTWYVRDGGGAYGTTSTTCNGKTNAVFTGSNGPNCAVSNPGYILGWGCNAGSCDSGTPPMVGGDTLNIDGDSDLNPGQQAQYEIGFNASTPGLFNNNGHGNCISGSAYICGMGNVPAGTASQQTSVIGTGTNKPQLWGTGGIYYVITADNNYTTLQWLEVTDHSACAYNDPTQGCPSFSGNPAGVARQGVQVAGTGVILTDVYAHGLGVTGINTESMGNATFTRVWAIGNGFAGMSVGADGNEAMTGTLTWNQPIIEWNGCVEQYPMTSSGIDNPANYKNCFGQQNGGYGDGLPFGATANEAAGNWTIIGPGSISFNTQDGLDILHGILDTGVDKIDKMRFEGNGGQQLKITALNDYITNNLIIGDCGWWLGAPQSLSGGMQNGDSCRAAGSTIAVAVTNNGVYDFYNNTLIASGGIAFETNDEANTGCNASTALNIYNNIILGGVQWNGNTGINSSGGNALDTYYYNDGFNAGGSCSTLVAHEDYNIISGMQDTSHCAGTHDKCNTAPGFSSGTFPNGTAGGGKNSYYTGNSAMTLVSLASNSPAVAAGESGLSYWNNGNDYYNVTRTTPPSVGGLEASSCAASGYGCFYNSDCCSGATCSNFTCGGTGGSKSTPVVSITNPVSGISITVGNNVTVTSTASETNGTISNISLYNGSTLLGSSSSSTYSYVMNNAPVGIYTLTAKATDANGVSTTSAPVIVTVVSIPILPSLPVVTITSPSSGSTFTAGSSVTVTTTASETNGTISTIALYNGAGVLLGSSSSSPYSYVSTNTPAGSYTFYAVATDANGVSVTSNPITVTVSPTPVTPSSPVVAITSPSSGSTFTAGSNVTITMAASEANGTISTLSLYNGSGLLLGSTKVSDYNFLITNISAGTDTFYTVATDANGVSTKSSSITITVTSSSTAPSITSQPNSVTVTAPATATFTVAATGTPAPTYQWKQEASGASSFTSISGATSASYTTPATTTANSGTKFECVVTNSAGSVTSNTATLTINPIPVSAPVIAITSPSTGTSFTSGTNISITATASESNGTISKVNFYNGNTLLGSKSKAPYNYAWSNVPAGTYSLTAVAMDVKGVSKTSNNVKITVAQVRRASNH